MSRFQVAVTNSCRENCEEKECNGSIPHSFGREKGKLPSILTNIEPNTFKYFGVTI